MQETQVKSIVRKNYGCERRVWKKMHHDAIKTHKTVACLDFRNIQLIEKAEAINDYAIEQFGVSFDEVPTSVITKYDNISDPTLKYKVFMKIKEIIENGKHPFNGKQLNRYGITIPMMNDIIEYCRCGHVTKKVNRTTDIILTPVELDTLYKMKTIASRYHSVDEYKYNALYEKIKAHGERTRYRRNIEI